MLLETSPAQVVRYILYKMIFLFFRHEQYKTNILAGLTNLYDSKPDQKLSVSKVVQYDNYGSRCGKKDIDKKRGVYPDGVSLIKVNKNIIFNSKVKSIDIVLHDDNNAEKSLQLIGLVYSEIS